MAYLKPNVRLVEKGVDFETQTSEFYEGAHFWEGTWQWGGGDTLISIFGGHAKMRDKNTNWMQQPTMQESIGAEAETDILWDSANGWDSANNWDLGPIVNYVGPGVSLRDKDTNNMQQPVLREAEDVFTGSVKIRK